MSLSTRDRILLAYVPLGLIQVPPLGLSLLKARLSRIDVPCDIRYFNLEFVDACLDGEPAARARMYTRLTTRHHLTFAIEAIAAGSIFGCDDRRERGIAALLERASPDERTAIDRIARRWPAFVQRCVDSVEWSRYRILGLSTVFLGMTAPAVLFAREVKRRHPHITTVLGGPNTEGTMGEVLARQFPEIDFVLRGEADDSWPALVQHVLAGTPPPSIPGLVQRLPDGRLVAAPAQRIEHLDRLPYPDFDDFVDAVSRSSLSDEYVARLRLPFESSRGCWWGQVSHCKFCGINGDGMPFRSKSRDRLLDEIDWLQQRYQPTMLLAADAILDHRYFGNVLPALGARRDRVSLSYEVKANLTRAHVAELHTAGIDEILPGIETFSTRILKLMKKGSTAFDNLLCLRLAEEFGLTVSWYHMCGLPGERVDDYERDVRTIQLIPHLQPPKEIARFTLQRFTPYHTRAEAEGLANVRAMDGYAAVFPFPQSELDDLAYHFDFDFRDGRDDRTTAAIETMLDAAVAAWKARYGHARLDLVTSASGAVIVDQRWKPLVFLLDRGAADLYTRLDRPLSAALLADGLLRARRSSSTALLDEWLGDRDAPDPALLHHARQAAEALDTDVVHVAAPPPGALAASSSGSGIVSAWLAPLVDCGLVYEEDGRYLALAVPRRSLAMCIPTTSPAAAEVTP